MMKPDPTETSIETKRQYLVAVEDLADRLRRDLELAVSKANPEPVTPTVTGEQTWTASALPMAERIDHLEDVLKTAEVALRSAAEEREGLRSEIGRRDVQMLKLESVIKKQQGDLSSLNRHVGQLNEWLVEERRRADALDARLGERDREVEALEFELGQTKRQLADRDALIERLIKRINAIHNAADLAAEWP